MVRVLHWRKVVAVAAAYAIALQALLLAAQPVSAVTLEPAHSFEICQPSADGSATDTNAPQTAGKVHCSLCVTAGAGGVLPPTTAVFVRRPIPAQRLSIAPSADPLALAFVRSGLSRAPPLAA